MATLTMPVLGLSILSSSLLFLFVLVLVIIQYLKDQSSSISSSSSSYYYAENDYYPKTTTSCDVLIYGATPAGISAAISAAETCRHHHYYNGRNEDIDDVSCNAICLLEPSNYVGGMATAGGIGFRDFIQISRLTQPNSTILKWGMLNARHYYNGSNSQNPVLMKPVWQPDNHIGEKSFRIMLHENPAIQLFFNISLLTVTHSKIDPLRIRSITAQRNTIVDGGIQKFELSSLASVVIDASYTLDLGIAAGVSATIGRESRDTYNESLGGVSNNSTNSFPFPGISGIREENENEISNVNVDSSRKDKTRQQWRMLQKQQTKKQKIQSNHNATVLKYIQLGPDPSTRVGESDDNVMAYSYRVCFTTNKTNQVRPTPPLNYDSKDFELAARLIDFELKYNQSLTMPWGFLHYRDYPPSNKFDACCGNSPFGIDAAGLAVKENILSTENGGTATTFQDMISQHEYYVKGLIWFWMGDPGSNVPKEFRKRHLQKFGLCKDEWPDNDHFPPQLYVREAARLVGDIVFTQNDRIEATNGTCNKRSIATGDWGIDIHQMQRVLVYDSTSDRLIAKNEGLTDPGLEPLSGFDLSFDLLLPKASECTNLLVPVCPSVSHVAFSAIRVEPTLWALGQASGIAAVMSLKQQPNRFSSSRRYPKTTEPVPPVQELNVSMIRSELQRQNGVYQWPINKSNCPP